LWDGGENITPITRVEDFAQAAVELLGNKSAYNQAFHIVGDDYYKWIDVIQTIEEILEKKAILVDVPKEFLAREMPHKRGEILGGRSINFRYDNSKIKSVVPFFRNTISLKEGMIKTIDYYKANGYLNGIDYSFDADLDRIVFKLHKYKKHKERNNYNISYSDYLNEGKLQNRIDYLLSRYKNMLFVKILRLAKRVIHKLK